MNDIVLLQAKTRMNNGKIQAQAILKDVIREAQNLLDKGEIREDFFSSRIGEYNFWCREYAIGMELEKAYYKKNEVD